MVAPPVALGEPPYRILFVCTGNICRSPMAEIITRTLAEGVTLDDGTILSAHLELSSAGTGPWHEGEPMHANTAKALARGGYPDQGHVAHQVVSATLGDFDLVVPLDRRHSQTLRGLGAIPERLILLRAFDTASGAAADVPDPFYGDDEVFDQCRDMIDTACAALVGALGANWASITAH
jgi:protein-tyrosine phosphatase